MMHAPISRRNRFRAALLAAVLLCLAACFPQPPGRRRGAPPGLEPLYATIRECRADYERGLELIASGDSVMGRNMVSAATTRLSAFAEECAAQPGCEPELFDLALDDLVRERRKAVRARRSRPEARGVQVDENIVDGPVVDAIPEMRRTVSMLGGTELRELITLNEPVKAALNDWLTWNRPTLMEAYENYQYLRLKVAPVYEKAGLPEALLFAMMAQETGVRVHAYSPAGAVGPLQFMRHTGRRYGLHYVDGFDMRLDPVAATRASARYLNDQFTALNQDLAKTLAAYNSGETRLRRLDRKLDGAEFWEPQMYYSVPAETRDYVPQILAAAWLFLHPEDYGLRFPKLETNTTTIVLKEAISLDELAICLGQLDSAGGWFRTLRNLNPRLRPGRRIAAGARIELPSKLVPIYERQCVQDAPLLEQARLLHAAAYTPRPGPGSYTVRSGDTLASIAKRHGCDSVSPVAKLNGIRGPAYVIRVGQRIRIPDCS